MKTSDLCILVSVGVAFITTAYLWFNGQKEEGLFTATWIPSILTFAIYFKLITGNKNGRPINIFCWTFLLCFSNCRCRYDLSRI